MSIIKRKPKKIYDVPQMLIEAQRSFEDDPKSTYRVVITETAHMKDFGHAFGNNLVFECRCKLNGLKCGNQWIGPECNECNVPIIYKDKILQEEN